MQPEGAVAAFAASGQEHRLAVFRMPMEAEPAGMRAGLLHSWRVRRSIVYAVDGVGTRELVTVLTRDRRGGRPEPCGRGEPDAACGDAPPSEPARRR
jgi:hypothetical protein